MKSGESKAKRSKSKVVSAMNNADKKRKEGDPKGKGHDGGPDRLASPARAHQPEAVKGPLSAADNEAVEPCQAPKRTDSDSSYSREERLVNGRRRGWVEKGRSLKDFNKGLLKKAEKEEGGEMGRMARRMGRMEDGEERR
jgi:hypothetical protein